MIRKQEAYSKREMQLLELKLIGKKAEDERVRAVKAAAAANLAVANAQQRLAPRAPSKVTEKQALVAAWDKLSLAAAETRRADQYEQYKGRFNIFRRAINSIQLAEYRNAIDDAENTKKNPRQA